MRAYWGLGDYDHPGQIGAEDKLWFADIVIDAGAAPRVAA
jgi:hypothetical protein